LRQEIEGFIPQIPLIRIQEQLARAQAAMEKERWSQALPYLEEAVRLAPKAVLPQFYQAICHFKLEHWDEAERIAKKALPLCGKGDEQLREQLQLMLEQIPKAREAALLGPISKALEREDWRSGLKQAEEFLRTRDSTHPVVLFYKAVCEFKLGKRAEAKSTAQKALEYATGSEYASVRQQLNQIIEAANVPTWVEDMNKAVQAMNRQRWGEAIPHLDKVLKRDSTAAQAYYYRALCKHQSMMELINQGGGLKREMLQPTINWFQDVRSDLDKAERHRSYSEYELGEGISKLSGAVDNVLDQLRRL
jgi:tetratricopeptide (TPR) repeat protein